MKCVDIMTRSPMICVPEDNVAVAIDLMWDNDCGCIPVVKDMDNKELVGIVTDRDIVMCTVKHMNMHHSQIRVSDCMSSPAIFCLPEDPIEKAIELMSEYKVRRMPIVDENQACLGIISQSDFLLKFIDMETVIDDMESIIDLLRKISVPYSKEESLSISTQKEEESASEEKEISIPIASSNKEEISQSAA